MKNAKTLSLAILLACTTMLTPLVYGVSNDISEMSGEEFKNIDWHEKKLEALKEMESGSIEKKWIWENAANNANAIITILNNMDMPWASSRYDTDAMTAINTWKAAKAWSKAEQTQKPEDFVLAVGLVLKSVSLNELNLQTDYGQDLIRTLKGMVDNMLSSMKENMPEEELKLITKQMQRIDNNLYDSKN